MAKNRDRAVATGDFVEMDLGEAGICYLQILHLYPEIGFLARFFPGIYAESSFSIDGLTTSQEEFLAFSYAEGMVKSGDARIIGHASLPARLIDAPILKSCKSRCSRRPGAPAEDCWWLHSQQKSWRVGKLPRRNFDAPMTTIFSDWSLTGRLRIGWHPRDEVKHEHRFSGDGYLYSWDDLGNQYEHRPEGKVLYEAVETRDPAELGIFTNDSAADWVAELSSRRGIKPLRDAIEKIDEDIRGFCDAEDAERALAACGLLAAKINPSRSSAVTPEEAEKFLTTFRTPKKELSDRAIASIRRIEEKSELRDLWETTDMFDDWKRLLADLVVRLEPPTT